MVENLNKERIEEVLYKPIEYLGLLSKANNVLIGNKIYTIKDLVTKEKRELLNLKNIGPITVNEITKKIHLLGLKFADEQEIELIKPTNPNLLNESIKILGLSPRANNILYLKEIYVIGILINRTTQELEEIPGIGPKLSKRIINKIHSLGFKFKDEENVLKNNDFNNSNIEAKIEYVIENNQDLQARIDRKKSLAERLLLLKEQEAKLLKEELELDNKINQILNELNEMKKYGRVKG